MRLEDGRREHFRRPFLSADDWRLLIVGLTVIGVVAGVLLYFSTPLADTMSRRMMDDQTKAAVVSD